MLPTHKERTKRATSSTSLSFPKKNTFSIVRNVMRNTELTRTCALFRIGSSDAMKPSSNTKRGPFPP